MTKPKSKSTSRLSAQEALEQAAAAKASERYVLRLYISGITPRSTQAIQNIRKICEEHLEGRYDLQVIDIYQQPTLAEGEQIIAAPTLIKKLPLPLRRFIGDMSNTERILLGMDLRSVEGRVSRVEGRGARVEGRGARVEGRGARTEGGEPSSAKT
jgi:circadian clock protein KaiB